MFDSSGVRTKHRFRHYVKSLFGAQGLILLGFACSIFLLQPQTTQSEDQPAPVKDASVKDAPGKAAQPAAPAKAAKLKAIPKITISKETTWATEPVGASGFINYLTVINRRTSVGITPENNAAVMLYRATGPAPENVQRQPDRFFQLMGIDPLPDQGPYFEEYPSWYKRMGKQLPPATDQALIDQVSTAQTRPWTTQEFPEVAQWLTQMGEPLARVTDATERPEYFSPLVASDGADEGDLIQVLLPGVQKSRSLARALMMRAMLRLSEGDGSQAWAEVMTIHRLGRLVGRGPTIIEGLVGIAIESMATEAELRIISQTQPNSKFIARYRKSLLELQKRSVMADKIDQCERAMFLDCCQKIFRRKMKINDVVGNNGAEAGWFEQLLEGAAIQAIDWDEVLKSGNRWYDRMVIAARLPKYEQRHHALNQLNEELKKLRQQQPSGLALLGLVGNKSGMTEMAADTLIGLLLPAVSQCIKAETRCEQRFRNVEIALNLAEFHSEKGSYPNSLDELDPKLLTSPPIDLFNNKPLHYTRTDDGYLLYSVGENFLDEAGRSYDDMPRGDDLIVKVPYPTAKP